MPPRRAWTCARGASREALRPEAGERWSNAFGGEGCERELLEWLKELPGAVRCAHESGRAGFRMSRLLADEGTACEVMAVSTLPRSPKSRRREDDRHDAGVAPREARDPASDVSYAWAPGPEAGGARGPARAADAASRAARSAKQRGGMLLIKRGFAWDERAPGGNLRKTRAPAWRKRALSCDLGDPMPDRALRMEVEMAGRMGRGAEELAKAVAEEAEKPRWKPCVDALMRLKGIDAQAAFLARAGLGDLSRPRGGRRAPRRIGRAPSEGSTGDSRRQGKITKEGGSYLRHALVEGVSSISRQTAHKKRLRPGRAVSPQVEDIALEANARLKRKHDALKDAGKRADTAKVAVVSEPVRWTRAIGPRARRGRAAA